MSTPKKKKKGPTNREPLGYKYWVAFEVRCLDTDKRMFQNHAIYRNKEVVTEEDIESVEQAFLENIEKHSFESDYEPSFKIKLTCWPHLMGRMEIHQQPVATEAPAKEEVPPQKAPFLQLVVNNKEIEELTT